jgi:sugar transferase (PEP-CTERM system associated)
MRRIFKVHSWPVLKLLAGTEALLLLTVVYVGFMASYAGVSDIGRTAWNFAPEALLFAITLVTSQYAFGLYRWEYSSKFSDVVARMTVAFACGFIFLSVVFYVFPFLEIWRSAAAVAFPLGFVCVLATRVAFSRIADRLVFKRRILVIGVGDLAARIENLETAGKAYRFCCVAFVDVHGEERKVSQRRVIPKLNSYPDYIAKQNVDEIIIAIRERRGNLPLQSLMDVRLTGTPVMSYQAFFERETGRIELDALKPEWFVFSSGFPGGDLQHMIKRGFDIAMSALMLLFCLPVMVITAIAIRLEGKAPILFRQQRTGFRGETFFLYKFRSMRVDAERDGVPRWAHSNDPRVTFVGSFIRATRIDELPQLYNILKGDMSLVGPRPERPYFVSELSQVIPFYNERHRVKPGLAGWAQLYYPYGESHDDAKKKLEYDLYYIKYFSVLRDLIIIIQTIRVVVWPNRVR